MLLVVPSSRSSLFYKYDINNNARQRAARPTVVHAPLSAGVQSYAFMVLCHYHTIGTCYNRVVPASSGCTSTILQYYLLQRTRRRGDTIISLDLFLRFTDIHYVAYPNVISLLRSRSFSSFFLFTLVTIRSHAIVAWFPFFTLIPCSRSFSRSPLSFSITLILGAASLNIVLLFLPFFPRNFHSIKKEKNEEKYKIALSL